MIVSQLFEKCRETLLLYGDLPVKLEIRDHGAVELLEPTTTWTEHEKTKSELQVGPAITFLISVLVD